MELGFLKIRNLRFLNLFIPQNLLDKERDSDCLQPIKLLSRNTVVSYILSLRSIEELHFLLKSLTHKHNLAKYYNFLISEIRSSRNFERPFSRSKLRELGEREIENFYIRALNSRLMQVR